MLDKNISVYSEAKRICMDAIRDFRYYTNDFLPDEKGKYLFDWEDDDVSYIGKYINIVVDSILSTVMRDHVAYELISAQSVYADMAKKQNKKACMAAFVDVNKIVNDIAFTLSKCSF